MRPRSYGTAGKILRLHKGEIPMFDSNHVFLGIAPIGWCNDDMPELGGENTFQQTVSEMALAGFTGCEIGNKYPKDPAKANPLEYAMKARKYIREHTGL